jgi:CDP-diacylglycerol--glycerol-3-phosphate 3-phosphatidyltransferase
MVLSALPETPITPRPPQVLNLPNLLTLSRLALAVVFFALLVAQWYLTSFVFFVIAASTDWLDGYVARKRGETTVLGRILDPFVDKVIVLGAFVFLLAEPASGVAAWMVTVIIARELLVTGLRSYLEGESVAFGADWAGKLKMVLQCVAIGGVLLYLGLFTDARVERWGDMLIAWAVGLRTAVIWVAVVVTALSGIGYACRAALLIRDRTKD